VLAVVFFINGSMKNHQEALRF